MYKILLTILFVLFSFIPSGGALGAEFCVSTAAELQAALDTAVLNAQADTIKVVQGIYNGNFHFYSTDGHSITIKGGYSAGCASREIDPSNTILNGTPTKSALKLVAWNSGDIFVEGFTVQNGKAYDGGGMYIVCYSDKGTAGNITVTRNIVLNNTADDHDGGGIFAESRSISGTSGNVTIISNIVKGNTAGYEGGGIFARSLSNTGTTGDITLTNNIVAENVALYGGGVNAFPDTISGTTGNVYYTNNTITGNTASTSGGGIRVYKNNNLHSFFNNIIWGNTGNSIVNDIDMDGTGNAYAYTNDYSVMNGSWTNSENNIDINPNFIGSGNYHLQSNSPCIDVGRNIAPGLPPTDFEGDERIYDGDNNGTATVDIGADEYHPNTVSFGPHIPLLLLTE